MKKLSYLLLLALFVVACGADKPASTEDAETTTVEEDAPVNTFGETISEDGAIGFEAMLAQLENQDSVAVKVKGEVESVCQMKGCWMNLKAGEELPQMRVRFKDYGFFMPMDIAGRDVIVDGYAYRTIVPVDELRHLAEDEGLSKEEIEAITEPEEELTFMASGVLLLEE